MFLAHGVVLKLLVFTLPGTAGFFESLGLPGWSAYAVFAAEAVGGAMLVLGIQARWVALALLPVLLGAVWAHAGNGWMFTAPNGGWEYPLYLSVLAVAQAMLGDGAYALVPSTPLGRPPARALDQRSPNTEKLTLISHHLCPYVQRAAIALAEKGVPFERINIDLADKPDWFLAHLAARQGAGVEGGRDDVIFEFGGDPGIPGGDPAEPAAPGRPAERGRAPGLDRVRLGGARRHLGLLHRRGRGELRGARRRRSRRSSRRLEIRLGDGPWFDGARFSLVDAVFARSSATSTSSTPSPTSASSPASPSSPPGGALAARPRSAVPSPSTTPPACAASSPARGRPARCSRPSSPSA